MEPKNTIEPNLVKMHRRHTFLVVRPMSAVTGTGDYLIAFSLNSGNWIELDEPDCLNNPVASGVMPFPNKPKSIVPIVKWLFQSTSDEHITEAKISVKLCRTKKLLFTKPGRRIPNHSFNYQTENCLRNRWIWGKLALFFTTNRCDIFSRWVTMLYSIRENNMDMLYV